MFCGKCGKEIRVGNQYCTGCGERADSEEEIHKNDENDLLLLRHTKTKLKEFLALGDIWDKTLSISAKIEAPTSEAMKYQLMSFCLYLLASSNEVSEADARFMQILFDYPCNKSSLSVLINRTETKGFPYKPAIPPVFMLVLSLDILSGKPMCCELLSKMHKAVGQSCICNTAKSDAKNQAFDLYMYVIEEFVKSESQKIMDGNQRAGGSGNRVLKPNAIATHPYKQNKSQQIDYYDDMDELQSFLAEERFHSGFDDFPELFEDYYDEYKEYYQNHESEIHPEYDPSSMIIERIPSEPHEDDDWDDDWDESS